MKKPFPPIKPYNHSYIPTKPQTKRMLFVPITKCSTKPGECGTHRLKDNLPPGIKLEDVVIRHYDYDEDYDGSSATFITGYLQLVNNEKYHTDLLYYEAALGRAERAETKYRGELKTYEKKLATYKIQIAKYNRWFKKTEIVRLETQLAKLKSDTI